MDKSRRQIFPSPNSRGYSILLIPLLALILIAVFLYTVRKYYPDLLSQGIDTAGRALQQRTAEHAPQEIQPSRVDIEKAMAEILTERDLINRFGLHVRADETYLITLKSGATFVAKDTKLIESEISFTDSGGLSVSLNRDSIQTITKIKNAPKQK